MKKCVILFFFVTTFINSQDIIVNPIKHYEPINNDNLKAVIYYIPFSILTRASLNADMLKKQYFIKIEIPHNDSEIHNFLKGIENTKYTILDDRFDMRCLIEFYYNDVLIFEYGLDGNYVFINGKRINYDKVFYNFVLQYLPKKYEYDIEYIIKRE